VVSVLSNQWRSQGTLRPGARNIFAPPVIKTAEFKVKNRCKSAEKVKAEHVLELFCSFLRVMKRTER